MSEKGRCWCGSTLKDKPHNCIGTRGRVEELLAQNAETLRVMNDVHSLLSLVRHRHLPRGMESLEKDIDKALAASEKALREWWAQEMARAEKRNDEKPSRYGWSSDPQTDTELQKKYGDSVHRPKREGK